MQGLYLFFGEKGTFKDEVFDMFPQLGEKQVLFSKITIKQYEYNKLLINFPDVIDIEQEIHHLLSLTQISDINQFVIFLNYEVQIVNKMANIKKKILEQFNYPESSSSIFTFFVNKSQQNYFDKKNRVYYFQNLNSIDKGQIQVWFKQNTQVSLRMNQLKIKEKDLSKIFYDAQTRFISILQQNQLESNLLNLLNPQQDQTISALIDLNKNYINSLQTEFYCDLILLSVFAMKNKHPSISLNYQNCKLTNIQYCTNCSIIYQRISNGWMINQIYLFKFSQQSFEDNDLSMCLQCNKYLCSTIGFSIIKIFQYIYFLQMINSYYKKNFGIFQCKETLKNWEQEKQNERKGKALALMLISCESQQKSSLFQKAYEKPEYIDQNLFIEGDVLLDKFYLIDSPNFSFDEDQDQREALFSKYLNNNPLHFIFYCINYQRTSLMKDKVIQMLKSFPNVNKDQMGVIIFNLNSNASEKSLQKCQSESEIIKSMQGLLKQVIVVGETDNQNEVIEKIQNCVKNIDISQELSFKDTIFGIQEDDSSQIQLQQQFQQIAEKIQNDSKLQQQQLLLDYQNRQQQLENKLNEMNQIHQQKLKSYQEIIQQTMQKMNEEKGNFQKEQKKIQDELYSIQQQKQNHQYSMYENRQIQYRN